MAAEGLNLFITGLTTRLYHAGYPMTPGGAVPQALAAALS